VKGCDGFPAEAGGATNRGALVGEATGASTALEIVREVLIVWFEWL
jgi:hypothetical protein